MTLNPIFNSAKKRRPMRVAGFMSGTGTNIKRLIEHQKRLEKEEGRSPFEVVFIFSDRSDGSCVGERIAYENVIPYFSYDIKAFYRRHGVKFGVDTPEGLQLRKEFDRVAASLIKAFDVDIVALGGYMSYTTIKGCINVHPADLSIRTPDGKRKYTGINAVKDAILSGEKFLRSSTIITDEGIDTGPILMVSRPIQVKIPVSLDELKKDKVLLDQVVQEHQERLKRIGDWHIFPRTIELIARGHFALDRENRVYFDTVPAPEGYRED